jgi:hypothetical protein
MSDSVPGWQINAGHQGDRRQPTTKPVQEVSQSSEHRSLFLSPASSAAPTGEIHARVGGLERETLSLGWDRRPPAW